MFPYGNTGYYRLIQATIGYNRTPVITTGYYRLVNVAICYYRLMKLTTSYFKLLQVTTFFKGYYNLLQVKQVTKSVYLSYISTVLVSKFPFKKIGKYKMQLVEK